eukprot:220517_1
MSTFGIRKGAFTLIFLALVTTITHLAYMPKDSLPISNTPNFNNSEHYTSPAGQYFDLSQWHVQVPEEPINHQSDELTHNYSSRYFYYDQSDHSMVFMCPNIGATTTTSTLIRTELANDNLFQITNSGYYYQNATLMICNTSRYIIENDTESAYSIVVSQIHGIRRALPLVVVQWYSHDNSMVAYYKLNNATVDHVQLSKNQKVVMGTIPMGVKFTVCIIVDDGILSVHLNSKQYLSVDATKYWTFKNYFKIGNYFHHHSLDMTLFPDWQTKVKVFNLTNIHQYSHPKSRKSKRKKQKRIQKTIRKTFPFYVFQVGFNKCGTRTLYKFFQQNKLPSVHNRNFNGENSNVSLNQRMKKLYRNNESILGDLEQKYMFYSDFGIASDDNMPWYRTLMKEYPNMSKIFIFNYRSINNWLKSRYIHYAPFFGNFIIFKESERKKQKYLSENDNNISIDDLEIDVLVLKDWMDLWYDYVCGMIAYFIQVPQNSKSIFNELVLFDIENDEIDKLIDVFGTHGIELDSSHYHITGQVSKFQKISEYADIVNKQISNWDEITRRYPDFDVGFVDGFDTEYERIANKCSVSID